MQTSFFSKLVKYKLYLLMLAPAVLYYIIFCYLPMAGIVVTFKRFDYVGGIFRSPWVGFDNFKFLFISGKIFEVARNTVVYNIIFLLVNTTLQITVAVMITEIAGKYFKKITQSLLLLPYFISWVVVGAFVYNLFNNEFGFMNTVLKTFHMDPVNIYDKPFAWAVILVVFCLWKNLGYGSVLYIAAITGIEREMYESAEIDGANIFQRIRHITLPSISQTIAILILLQIGSVFRGDFSMFYQIIGENSMVYNITDVIDTFVIRSLTTIREFGMTSAAGLIQSVLCFVIINIANYSVRKVNKDYALY